ncbi:hypothetical protein WB388_18015 [Streptomyces brasiliscabiei]|uniref:Uncharacterized protein n=1 Tax=Streptomyces brasiliscabiei TaxID=2736302 RepID=A0ABU8GJE1_9ACTN
MTTEPTGPPLWQRLVQWQPAEAALLAQHTRDLPDDWPLRVFGVGRPDAALLLPPGATGEQYPDRAPEIAPFDEIATLEECPACEEAEGLCRWHEGYAAAHQAQTQAQLEAAKARPEISLRAFLQWQADVTEAEDRGEQPPLLPAAEAPTTTKPEASAAIRRKLRQWAYAAGHIESELDGAVDRMYALIAQDVAAGVRQDGAQPS